MLTARCHHACGVTASDQLPVIKESAETPALALQHECLGWVYAYLMVMLQLLLLLLPWAVKELG